MFPGKADYSTVYDFDTASTGVDAACCHQARMPGLIECPPIWAGLRVGFVVYKLLNFLYC